MYKKTTKTTYKWTNGKWVEDYKVVEERTDGMDFVPALPDYPKWPIADPGLEKEWEVTCCDTE